MTPKGNHFIAGEWNAGNSETSFRAFNPVSLKYLEPEYMDPDSEQVSRSVESAQEAFPEYRKLSTERKAHLLESISLSLEQHASVIQERACAESGLSEDRIRFEFMRTVDQPRRFAKLLKEGSWINARIDTADLDRQPRPKPDMRTMLQPIGPVAVFGASNFPLAISVMGTDSVSALAAGCPVIVKGHPAQPGTCELTAMAVEEALMECNMSSGVFSLLHGSSHEVGQDLVRHPGLKGVAFTGSLIGGRSLMDLAASRPVPIPVFAEMGSLNPVFLLPDALASRPESIAQGLVQSLTMDAGQFCTNPGILVALDSPALDTFVDLLIEKIAGVAPQAMLHKGIYRAYQERLKSMTEVNGVRVVTSSPDKSSEDNLQAYPFLLETDFATWMQNSELQKECFGPSTILIRAQSVEEFHKFATNMNGSLTATLHGTTKDYENHATLQELLEIHVGRLVFNGFPTGVEIGHATHHGGPYPATSTQVHTSIGPAAIERFVRPVCYQNCPQDQLPDALKNKNPQNLYRVVDGVPTTEDIVG